MLEISITLLLIVALIMIVLGLAIAYKGFDLLEGFVRITGAVLGGIVFFLLGGVIGVFFGPVVALVLAIVMGILGIILGAILAPTLLWLMLSIIVFIIFFQIGVGAADDLGASALGALIVGIVAGILGAWLFSFLARKLLVGATSVMGGLLVGAGAFLISLEYLGLLPASIIAIIAFAIVAATGYGANRGKKKKRRSKKR